jgi:N-acyl-D-aspartate/D-glutamate deacylase
MNSGFPSNDELQDMKYLVEEAMEQGAIGLSTGLVYAPSIYSDTEELIELAKIVAKHDGIYTSHVRGMSSTFFNAAKEGFEIGRRGNLPVQISHINIGPNVWNRIDEFLLIIENERAHGLDVTADVLLYDESVFSGGSLFPGWANEGGIEERLKKWQDKKIQSKIKYEILTHGDRNGGSVASCLIQQDKLDRLIIIEPEEYNLVPFSQLPDLTGINDPLDAYFSILLDYKGKVRGISKPYLEEDIEKAIAHPLVMPSTDGQPLAPYGNIKPDHNRCYGTYAKLFEEFVSKKRILSISEAIRKSTSFPAQRLGIKDRGLIKENYWADIVIMDLQNISDKSSLENPTEYPSGFKHVLVNGKLVVQDGVRTEKLPGKVLRKN